MEQNPEDLRIRKETLGRWPIRITSYQLGRQFICTVDNVDPGAVIARAQAADRQTAEKQALQIAQATIKVP
jgi:hypothetical protein